MCELSAGIRVGRGELGRGGSWKHVRNKSIPSLFLFELFVVLKLEKKYRPVSVSVELNFFILAKTSLIIL